MAIEIIVTPLQGGQAHCYTWLVAGREGAALQPDDPGRPLCVPGMCDACDHAVNHTRRRQKRAHGDVESGHGYTCAPSLLPGKTCPNPAVS